MAKKAKPKKITPDTFSAMGDMLTDLAHIVYITAGRARRLGRLTPQHLARLDRRGQDFIGMGQVLCDLVSSVKGDIPIDREQMRAVFAKLGR